MKKVRSSVKYICMIALCTCLIFGNSLAANAMGFEYDDYRKEYGSKLDWVFDPVYYAKTYPDVANDSYYGKNKDRLFEHYTTFGIYEGRWGTKNFNCLYYVVNSPDLRNAYGTVYTSYLKHYINYGKAEGRAANTVVSPWIRTNKHLLGAATVKVDPKNTKMLHNIMRSASLINGLVLAPNQEFSYDDTILKGPHGVERPLYVIAQCANNPDISKYGGGICITADVLQSALTKAGFSPENHMLGKPGCTTYHDCGCSANFMKNENLTFVNISGKSVQFETYLNNSTGELTVAVYYLD